MSGQEEHSTTVTCASLPIPGRGWDRFDTTLFVSAFGEKHEGHTSPMYQITGSPHGALHRGFRRLQAPALDSFGSKPEHEPPSPTPPASTLPA